MGRNKKGENTNYSELLKNEISGYQDEFKQLKEYRKLLIDSYGISSDGIMTAYDQEHVDKLKHLISVYEMRCNAHYYFIREYKWQLNKKEMKIV